MATFQYQTVDAAGRVETGVLEAESVQQAAAELESRGLTVQSIGFGQPATADDAVQLESIERPPVKESRQSGESVEQAVLRSHMATILERGSVIAPALKAFAEELSAGPQRRQLMEVCRILESGDATQGAAALARLPECWIPLLSSATSSTDPDHLLREFLTESQRVDELRHQWWLTLAYPLVLLCLTTAVFVVLSAFVIPQFCNIFRDFDVQLPVLTQIVLGISTLLSSWGGLILIALGIALVIALLNSSRFISATKLGWLSDRIRPPFSRRTAVARFAQFMADLLEANLSTPDALRIAGFAVKQSHVQEAAWELANDLESDRGYQIYDHAGALSATVLHALRANMPLAARVRLLREISACHVDRVRIGLSWATGIVEPMAICMVGCAVGLVVVALFLPLVKLITGLSS